MSTPAVRVLIFYEYTLSIPTHGGAPRAHVSLASPHTWGLLFLVGFVGNQGTQQQSWNPTGHGQKQGRADKRGNGADDRWIARWAATWLVCWPSSELPLHSARAHDATCYVRPGMLLHRMLAATWASRCIAAAGGHHEQHRVQRYAC